jgi:hypothetical protein
MSPTYDWTGKMIADIDEGLILHISTGFSTEITRCPGRKAAGVIIEKLQHNQNVYAVEASGKVRLLFTRTVVGPSNNRTAAVSIHFTGNDIRTEFAICQTIFEHDRADMLVRVRIEEM